MVLLSREVGLRLGCGWVKRRLNIGKGRRKRAEAKRTQSGVSGVVEANGMIVEGESREHDALGLVEGRGGGGLASGDGILVSVCRTS